jgi:hypothetical protein
MKRTILTGCLIYLLFGMFTIQGCATHRGNRWIATGAGVGTGFLVGSATAPAGERKELHSVYWASLLGLTASLIASEVFSDEAQVDKLTQENKNLGLQLELIQNAGNVLLREGKGYFKSPTGEELFSSGKAKWRLYQIDKWVRSGPNRLFHQDKMVELLPLAEDETTKK